MLVRAENISPLVILYHLFSVTVGLKCEVDVRSSLPPLCGSQELYSGYRNRHQVPLPPAASFLPQNSVSLLSGSPANQYSPKIPLRYMFPAWNFSSRDFCLYQMHEKDLLNSFINYSAKIKNLGLSTLLSSGLGKKVCCFEQELK